MKIKEFLLHAFFLTIILPSTQIMSALIDPNGIVEPEKPTISLECQNNCVLQTRQILAGHKYYDNKPYYKYHVLLRHRNSSSATNFTIIDTNHSCFPCCGPTSPRVGDLFDRSFGSTQSYRQAECCSTDSAYEAVSVQKAWYQEVPFYVSRYGEEQYRYKDDFAKKMYCEINNHATYYRSTEPDEICYDCLEKITELQNAATKESIKNENIIKQYQTDYLQYLKSLHGKNTPRYHQAVAEFEKQNFTQLLREKTTTEKCVTELKSWYGAIAAIFTTKQDHNSELKKNR